MNFLSYRDFLNEAENVKIDPDLREYSLTHVRESFFQLKSKDFYKEFNVMPYKNEELEKLKTALRKLEKSVESLDAVEMYTAIYDAELLTYHYGNIYNSKFELSTVPDLTIDMDSDLVNTAMNSPKEFLMNDYNKLNRGIKDQLGSELRERAEVLCCVIEALFYFLRTVDTDNFYQNMNVEEIIEEYGKVIKKAAKENTFSFEGPYSDIDRNELQADTRQAVWVCEKNLKKFIIRATVLPSELKAEENIGGTKGMKFSLLKMGEENPEKNYSFFPITELSNRIEAFTK
jgi:hypothetical protein